MPVHAEQINALRLALEALTGKPDPTHDELDQSLWCAMYNGWEETLSAFLAAVIELNGAKGPRA